jgi:hypothetical protein
VQTTVEWALKIMKTRGESKTRTNIGDGLDLDNDEIIDFGVLVLIVAAAEHFGLLFDLSVDFNVGDLLGHGCADSRGL